jgi:hypothetical protein
MRTVPLALLVTALSLVCAVPGRVAEPRKKQDPLVERVRQAIDGGIKYMRAQERGNGNLENTVESRIVPGGLTALGTLALLNAGVPPDDPMVQRCLRYLRTAPREQTYVVGLQTMVFVAAGQNEDRARIQRNADWLLAARHSQGGRLIGWTYGPGGYGADNSNTQYALLGLHEAHVAGAKIPPAVWKSIQDFYTENQIAGGWGYHLGEPPTPTMTEAGFCGLLIAGMDVNSGLEQLHPDGTVTHCGEYQANRFLDNALALLNQQMPRTREGIARMNHSYYWLYGLERCGRLSGQRFFGEVDWYRLGCEFLVDRQQPDGSWGSAEGHAIISASFALLFLSKGRTPVLISKLVHDPEDDWNNDRNDVRNLTAYASAQLFRKKPLAWQVFDARHAGDLTPDHIEELTADLLQSPIAYFNGHHAPRFTDGEEELLRKYLDNGGFLLAEACCDQEDFDKGFRALMGRLFPNTPLKKLDASHPIWTASGKFPIDADKIAANKFELWGIDMGCKTVVIYSRHDLSCRWESNKLDDRRVHDAFDLGLNIIAYATGLEPPKPRLTEMPVFKEDPTEKKSPRGYLKVGQLWHDGDWQPAPRAMPNLMLAMRQLGVDVSLQTEEVRLNDRDFPNFRFLYMHGRRGFAYSKEELKRLRFNLETGGLLLADACCGYQKSREFDESFRQLVKDLWPDKKLEEIPGSDDLFSAELNGTAITRVRCRRESPDGKGVDPQFQVVPPRLEGIKINGRWAVIYSKYDIGCALENRQSSDCLGHDHDSAVQLGKAVVLYAMRR